MAEIIECAQARRECQALFALLGLWMVDAFGQVERIVGFRRRRGRNAGWIVALETSDLAGMLARDDVRPALLGLLTGCTNRHVEWSEHAVWMIAFRMREQGLVLCRHLADAVCVARARRYWNHPFEMSGAGPMWCRADRQEARLRRLITLRRAVRAGLPPSVVDLLRQYLTAAETEPRYRSDSYLALSRRMHDERDSVGSAAWKFIKRHDLEVHQIAGRLWDRFQVRFLSVRERRLERWCIAQPGVAYCRPVDLDR